MQEERPAAGRGWFSLRSMREQIDEQVVRVFLPQLAGMMVYLLMAIVLIWRPEGLFSRA